MRLDLFIAEVQNKNLTRSKAQELIKSGCVAVNGVSVKKTGFDVTEKDSIIINPSNITRYVSRGGLKLEKAIKEFGLDFNGKHILDVGSSTGGFTDCSLKHGAASVVAIDVGREVMEKNLASNPLVTLYEQTDIREFDMNRLNKIDYIVCDVSFISLLSIIPTLTKTPVDCDMILLIKPQFECGPKIAHKYKGIINDAKIHCDVINNIVFELGKYNYKLENISFSPICGGDGNIEYISYFRYNIENKHCFDIEKVVATAFKQLKKE